jgi:hypothetical protein
MISRLRSVIAIAIFFTQVNFAWAQQPLQIKPAKPIICYQSHKDHHIYVHPGLDLRSMRNNATGRTKNANFEVEYINFPAEAKTAFDFAVAIWSQELTSPVTIKVRAEWRSIGAGVLGQAIWGSAFANFDNAPNINTFYPVALAEKIAAKELNASSDPDIEATFNSTTNWYFGTDGATPSGKTDLVTVALHEIAHGLGFTDTYAINGSTGSVGLENGGLAVPFVFDLFVENSLNKNFYTQVLSPSAEMKTQLTSGSVFFDGPMTRAENGNVAKLYSPSTFDAGSSISHLDEFTYNDANNSRDALMTPQIGTAEAIHNPGPIVRGTFSDMGWIFTRIVHTPLKDTERKDGAPYIVSATISSDNGYNASSLTLFFSDDGSNFSPVTMTAQGNNQFTAALPGTTVSKSYAYYIVVQDVQFRTFTNPGKVQTQNQPAVQQYNVFQIGPDSQAPVISHNPVEYIFEGTETIDITAAVTDNLGVDEVTVEYLVKEVPQSAVAMVPGTAENEYTATLTLPAGLVIDDKIEYRIVARDLASTPNQKTSPESDYHTIFVTGLKPVQDSYFNNFDTPSNDFIGNSFNIATPVGFDNGAIHSMHPYDNGSGPNNESNYIYQLQIPIRVNGSNPFIQFDEVVLIEPGTEGSVFGDADFFDYVIVEGSKDLGQTWHPFTDGYDSRNNADWLSKWNSDVSNDNSHASGDKALFRTRAISMVASGNFKAGDEVMIRFRLFADPAAYGWGWAIDNLYIQETVTSNEESASHAIKIYPVPVREMLTIETTSNQASMIRITDLQGQTLFVKETLLENRIEIDVADFSEGIYILQVQCKGTQLVKKFLKVR